MTKKRRYLISAAVLAACICLALGVLALLSSSPIVTKAAFERIKEGMSREAVKASIRQPPTVASTNQNTCQYDWVNPDGSMAIVFFRDDAVADMVWIDSTNSLTHKLRRWFGMEKEEPVKIE